MIKTYQCGSFCFTFYLAKFTEIVKFNSDVIKNNL